MYYTSTADRKHKMKILKCLSQGLIIKVYKGNCMGLHYAQCDVMHASFTRDRKFYLTFLRPGGNHSAGKSAIVALLFPFFSFLASECRVESLMSVIGSSRFCIAILTLKRNLRNTQYETYLSFLNQSIERIGAPLHIHVCSRKHLTRDLDYVLVRIPPRSGKKLEFM